jgi:hypothetical protein
MERDDKDNDMTVAAGATGRAVGKFSLTPRSISEAMQLAEMMAKSDLVPKDYRDKPSNILLAVQMGAEVGLAPMAALQGVAVINGRPGLYGDAGKALLLDRGFTIEEMDGEEIREKGYARCTITRPGGKPVSKTFSVEDAKTANLWGKSGPWSQYPAVMLAWRAFWFAARSAASDVLKGLGGLEELRDVEAREPRNITPEVDPAALMPKRASEAATGAAQESAAPTEVRFKIGKAEIVTAGMTEAQMLRSIELAKKVDALHGKGAAERCLNDEFRLTSRKELTEAGGEDYLAALERMLETPSREPGEEG